MDTKKDFHKAIANTMNSLHEQLNLIFQVKAQTIETEIRMNQNTLEAKIEAT
jgi:hypothetical protein